MSRSSKKSVPHRIHLSLPAKIAGIVFWGLVVVGLLLAVVLLQIRQHELVLQRQAEMLLVKHEIEHAMEMTGDHLLDLDYLHDLHGAIRGPQGVEAIEFDWRGQHIILGERNPNQDEYVHMIFVQSPAPGFVPRNVELKLYLTNLNRVMSDMRKNMLLIIGSLVCLFGLILQQILQRVLSKPFLNMVQSAEDFAAGITSARFDERREDEFGYLGKFINRALDSLLAQQREVENSRRALFEEKERAEVTLKSIMDGVVATDAGGKILYMNPVAERLSGRYRDEAAQWLLADVFKFVHEDSGKPLPNPVASCLQDNLAESLPGHAALMQPDGSAIPIEASAAPMRNDEGHVIGAVMVLQDVSQARRLTRQLSWQASHDALTGLYNRRMFEEHLEHTLLNVAEEDRHHALCYIDLDQFKVVNDTCGHMAGDELLRQVAVLLQGAVREGDVLARLGGDEFGVLLENCPIQFATQVADKIRLLVKEFRFVWQDKTFEIGASIGVVAIHAGNADMAGLFAAADVACYAAKDLGRNRVHVYEPTDAVLAERHGQMHWAARIVQSLENHRFCLFQQPVVPLAASDDTSHCEVLVRMKDENGEFIQPGAFIPAAERYNLMANVDRWVIEQVFRNMSQACRGTMANKVVAINLSGNSMADDNLLAFIRETGRAYGVNFRNVCFEITETAAISHLGKAAHFMTELRREGCRFSLDDFGSGLSSFAYLKNLPVDFIKIDGSFVKDMSTDPIDRAMVEAITRVGHVMQIKTIAEWVEDEDTYKLLKAIGVDYVQGYYLGSPQELGVRDDS
jgi:diguanylate cyclase (GGDEF)-like protein/PAS domain S-box-containing protein